MVILSTFEWDASKLHVLMQIYKWILWKAEKLQKETIEENKSTENQSDRKLYKCEPCDTTYSTSGNLARHRRQRHS